MKLWAIRHKPSGRLMPVVRGRGSTALNFHIDGFEMDFARHKIRKEPRLFINRIGAQRALSAWLKGEWVQETSRSGMYGDEVDVYTVPPDKPPADRRAEEMELVCFNLTPLKINDAKQGGK